MKKKQQIQAEAARLGRRFARGVVTDIVLRDWEPLWAAEEADGTVTVLQGGHELVRFKWTELRAELSPSHFVLVTVLFQALTAQAAAARWALPVAQVDVERAAKIAGESKAGGDETAKKYARPDLDDLIFGCLQRGGKTRDYAKQWAEDFNVSADTIERHIKRVKQRLDKG